MMRDRCSGCTSGSYPEGRGFDPHSRYQIVLTPGEMCMELHVSRWGTTPGVHTNIERGERGGDKS